MARRRSIQLSLFELNEILLFELWALCKKNEILWKSLLSFYFIKNLHIIYTYLCFSHCTSEIVYGICLDWATIFVQFRVKIQTFCIKNSFAWNFKQRVGHCNFFHCSNCYLKLELNVSLFEIKLKRKFFASRYFFKMQNVSETSEANFPI